MAFALMGNKHPFSIEGKFTYLARPEPLVLMEEVNKGDAISVNDLIRFILREYAKGKTKN